MNKRGKIWSHLWAIPMLLALIVLFGLAVMALWNALLPAIAGLPEITFWQAVGILVLARILFGGLGGAGWHHGHKNTLKERWQNMSDKEQKAFIAGRYGFHHPHGGGTAEGGAVRADADGREKE
jgi:hypothetical protein